MSEDQEKEFEKLCPMKSALGREYLALQAERQKQKQKFEDAEDKMDYDTTPYRRAEIALGRFLDDMLALLHKHLPAISEAKSGLLMAEYDAKNPLWGPPLRIDRRSEQIIWTRFAIERYRLIIEPKERKRYKTYHPQLWTALRMAWREFRKEIKIWQRGGQPYDGSQAMHTMIAFQLQCRLMASAND